MVAIKLPVKIIGKLHLLVFLVFLAGVVSCRQGIQEPPTPSFIKSTTVTTGDLAPPLLPLENNSLRFDHITLEDGLSQSTVNSIVQDHQGFMWFATNNGLNRYDGYEITVFKHDPSNPDTISDNITQVLFVDSHGDLWIGTEGGGLERFDREKETFIHHLHDPDDPTSISSDFIYAIDEDTSGALWLGTLDGLNVYDPNSSARENATLSVGNVYFPVETGR